MFYAKYNTAEKTIPKIKTAISMYEKILIFFEVANLTVKAELIKPKTETGKKPTI